jgi:hypothetical protein
LHAEGANGAILILDGDKDALEGKLGVRDIGRHRVGEDNVVSVEFRR